MMLELIVNGETTTLEAASLTDVLRAQGMAPEHWQALAVARNGAVVPRAAWQDALLQAGDRIDIVMPFAGG